MKNSIRTKLEGFEFRHSVLERLMGEPGATDDMASYTKLTKEYHEIGELVAGFREYKELEAKIADTELLVDDEDLGEIAREELGELRESMEKADLRLQELLLPRDEDDSKNVIFEIRAGAGGDEAAIFAGDLFRMYSRYIERKRWSVELISASESELGGYKEIIARVVGKEAYSFLKFESGGHRVQRVPETESQGRIHTSACTVAVMAEADVQEDLKSLDPKDIRIDTFRASGAGGQHINKTDSAIRITHFPSGMVVECQDGRSQHENKAQAMRVLLSRLNQKRKEEEHAKESAERKALVGTGDRSDRIRTYNYPQGRVTDHRINLTLYKLDMVMDGDLDEIIQALRTENTAMLLQELSSQN